MKLKWWKKTELDRYRARQELAKPGRYYGDGGTIHSNGYLSVETDHAGEVVAVWFRCQQLPFKQTSCNTSREAEMRRMYADGAAPFIVGVEVVDREVV